MSQVLLTMDAWVTVKIRKSLADKIDQFLVCKDEDGIAFWGSRADFVTAAVQIFFRQNEELLKELKPIVEVART